MTIAQWAPGTLYLPGTVVSRRATPGNVVGEITNPDFELGDLNWAKTGDFTIGPTTSFSGTQSAILTTIPATYSTLENDSFADCVPGQTVSLKCMIYADTLDQSISLGMRFYDAGNSLILTSGHGINLTIDEWIEGNASSVAPENAAFVRVYLQSNATDGIVKFDNFSWDLASSSSDSDGLVFKSIQDESGISGTEEPVWPTVVGGTVVDGTVTWEAETAVTVTWKAKPILVSGALEPTWPLINGAVVSDGSISWETTRLSIDDPNCPNTREVVIGASKIFAGDYDIVRFSATLNPRDWTSQEDAGFLASGLHQGEQVGVSALGVYRGNLSVWSESSFQVWQIDPDPSAMALLDAMEGIGSAHHKAVQPVSNDLFFLAALGVRTVGVAAGSTNLATGDAGVPVDTLIQEDMDGTVDPLATYYPSAGQYWLAFPPYIPSWPGDPDNPDNPGGGGPPEPEYQPVSGIGYSYTQDQYQPAPNFPHPFRNQIYNEFTTSAIFSPQNFPNNTEDTNIFGIMRDGAPLNMFARKRPINNQIYFQASLGSYDAGGPQSDSVGFYTFELTLAHPTWLITDWYWMALSYDSVGGSFKGALRNLTQGEEEIVDVPIVSQVPIEFDAMTLVASFCIWGSDRSTTQVIAMAMSQLVIHNKYIDLSVAANRNKFCCPTGVIDIGDNGEYIFGETPLVHSPRGFPQEANGTVFIGDLDDLHAYEEIDRPDILPPLCPGYVIPEAPPPEMDLPYWDNLGDGWIDLSKTTQTTFLATFGTTIEADDFESVFAIGGSLTPIASLVNTLDGGNQFSFVDDASMTEAIMVLINADGVVLDYVYYENVANTEFITVPTNGDHYIITASDTGNAKINKFDSTEEEIDPETGDPVSLTGSTPYLSVFGVEYLAGPSDDKSLIIPAEGIFIAFTVPVTALVYHGIFVTIGLTSISTTRSGALNRTVGDFNTPPTYIWGLGGGISYNINDPGYGDIDLVPGQTYILNLKNNTPAAANWMRIQHTWRQQ